MRRAVLSWPWMGLLCVSGWAHAGNDEYGGGVVVQTGPALITTEGAQRTVPMIGLEGVMVYKDTTRIGGEVFYAFGPVMQGGMGGVFSDLILNQRGNMKSYVGIGAGVGGARFTWGEAPYGQGFIYFQPSTGLQFNLKVAAMQVEVNYTLPITLLPPPEGFYPGHLGLSLGFLGGDFPPFKKKSNKSSPQRPSQPPHPQGPRPQGPRGH